MQAQALSHDHPAQVRIGVLALAIGILRVVVPPRILTGDQIVEEGPHIVQQRVLPLVDEDRRGGMKRLQMHHSFPDSALADDLVDAIRDVDQLHPIAGDPVHDAVEHLKSGFLRQADLRDFTRC